MATRRKDPNTSTAHYELLYEYHNSAARAADDMKQALIKKAEAEAAIADARKRLLNNQGLIDSWYSESQYRDATEMAQEAVSKMSISEQAAHEARIQAARRRAEDIVSGARDPLSGS